MIGETSKCNENVSNFIHYLFDSGINCRNIDIFRLISQKPEKNMRFLTIFSEFRGFGGVPIIFFVCKIRCSLRTIYRLEIRRERNFRFQSRVEGLFYTK